MSDSYTAQQEAVKRIEERLDAILQRHEEWEIMVWYFRGEKNKQVVSDVLYRLMKAEELRGWANKTINERPSAHMEAKLMIDLADEIESNIVSLYNMLVEIHLEESIAKSH